MTLMGINMNIFKRKTKSVKGGRKILIVDDQENILTLYKYVLEKEGFQVMTAEDGDEALLVAEKNDPELVLLDIMMPGVSGFDVLHALKRGNPSLPIILHSANKRFEDDLHGVTAAAFLEKASTGPQEVVKKIRELLD